MAMGGPRRLGFLYDYDYDFEMIEECGANKLRIDTRLRNLENRPILVKCEVPSFVPTKQ